MINVYYVIFLCAMNIIILNMLIAVLADTYERITEKRDKWAKYLKI